MAYQCCTDLRLGGWSHLPKLNILKFNSRGYPRSTGLPSLYGHETWWMESSLEANNSGGRFKVTRGHPRSIGVPLLYGHDTVWMESSLDANNP